MDAKSIGNYIKELESKVDRYEVLLDILSRPGNINVLTGEKVQQLAEKVYVNKEPIVNLDLDFTDSDDEDDPLVGGFSGCGWEESGC